MYKEFPNANGSEYLPLAWSLVVKPVSEASYWVQSQEDEALRACTLFRLTADKGIKEVLFCTNDPDTLKTLAEECGNVYLYGAYNQITVCQMRVLGSIVRKEDEAYLERTREEMRNILDMQVSGFTRSREDQMQKRLAMINGGVLFSFCPISYGFHIDERG